VSGVAGLLLAAGAGRRFGGPKALTVGEDGTPWLAARVAALADGGCAPVLVVLGAAADSAAALLTADAVPVVATDWDEGMGASLRAGLAAAQETAADAVLIALVDTPGLTADAVARVAATGSPAALAQATYDGTPGHPVLIGRAHWPGVAAAARGDRGARDYLAGRAVRLVECGDVGHGADVDVRPRSEG
jgi:CTP:molybdopterin cytidylyltransferase MocA